MEWRRMWDVCVGRHGMGWEGMLWPVHVLKKTVCVEEADEKRNFKKDAVTLLKQIFLDVHEHFL